jgi:hypothetical protein
MQAIDRKNLELFAYVIRVILTMIVEQAIRNRQLSISNEPALVQIYEPLQVEEYHEAT